MAKNDELMEQEENSGKSKKEIKKEEKERKKQEKKERKKNKEAEADDDEGEEKAGGKLVLFFVTLLIIAIWLGIIAILIKSDVGGFGSSVLYPMLKDVPYINQILPEPEAGVYMEQESQSPYGTLEEARTRIRELEQELDTALGKNSDDADTIRDLKAQIAELSVYKEDEAAFEREKEKFYEEVVLSDVAPDINEYRAYYESIDPENAAVLYKQVIEQITYDESVEDYVKTYSQMQPKDAAAIFDTMTNNLGLVADILNNMGTKARADILSQMDPETAARLTEIMEPVKK
ncbi:MAG: hypothetical protein NC180_08950 [Muribaculaceae bacterium]|nr:hypothetical protein [Muribaculaceae bacterium]